MHRSLNTPRNGAQPCRANVTAAEFAPHEGHAVRGLALHVQGVRRERIYKSSCHTSATP